MMSRTGNRGFTLVEVMIAAVVLALGSIFVYEALFTALDTFNYYTQCLYLNPWMDEKVWQAQDEIRRLGSSARIDTGGEVDVYGKSCKWGLNYSLIDNSDTKALYDIGLQVSWSVGNRKIRLRKSAYAIYGQKS